MTADPTTTTTTPAHHAGVVYYTLPARHLVDGMSTAHGDDIFNVRVGDDLVLYHAFTPSGDEAEDEERQTSPDACCDPPDTRVDLAVFPDTAVDGSVHPDAVITAP